MSLYYQLDDFILSSKLSQNFPAASNCQARLRLWLKWKLGGNNDKGHAFSQPFKCNLNDIKSEIRSEKVLKKWLIICQSQINKLHSTNWAQTWKANREKGQKLTIPKITLFDWLSAFNVRWQWWNAQLEKAYNFDFKFLTTGQNPDKQKQKQNLEKSMKAIVSQIKLWLEDCENCFHWLRIEDLLAACMVELEEELEVLFLGNQRILGRYVDLKYREMFSYLWQRPKIFIDFLHTRKIHSNGPISPFPASFEVLWPISSTSSRNK